MDLVFWLQQRFRGRMKRLLVQVRPAARQSLALGYDGRVVRIAVAAPATENRANEELVRFLAHELGIPPSTISIVRGHTARLKLVAIDQPAELVENWLERVQRAG